MVEEVGRGPSSGGKAPILLSVIDDARHVIGLDLGESTFVGALVNLRGEVRRSVELPVEGRDGDDALALVYRLVDELKDAGEGTLIGIGVGTPGVIDTRTGTIRWAVNLDWQDLPLGKLLHERYGVPVNVANDSQAAALAEYTFGGDATRRPNLVAIKVGRGIGAGIVLNGTLFQGDGFGAGEIGHIVVEDDGAECRCGRFGCLETVASGPAIVARARQLGLEAQTLDDVRLALVAGDEHALAAARYAGRFLGRAIASLIGAVDIHEVVVHGPVAELGRTVARGRPRRGDPPLAPAACRVGRDPHGADRGQRNRARGVGAADDPRARPEPQPMTVGHDIRDGTEGGLLAGVDIGGSKIAVLLADRNLAVRGRHLARTEVGDAGGAADQIAGAVDAALRDAGAARATSWPRSASASRAASIARRAPCRWRSISAGSACRSATSSRSASASRSTSRTTCGPRQPGCTNDASSATSDDLAYLSIGTGISAGVVLGGTLHRGLRGMAGEIGHVVLDPNGPRCPCGLMAASRPSPRVAPIAVAGRGQPWRRRRASVPPRLPAGQRGGCLRHAAAGDALALELAEAAGGWIARAVHELVMTYDVRRVVLGGGVTGAGETFLAPVLRALDELRAASELAREALPPDVVHLLPPDADAGGWGAVILARSAATVAAEQPAHAVILGREVASG